jgi:8-oxo-dGTP diphosphatase
MKLICLLNEKESYWYLGSNPTADAAVFKKVNNNILLLIKRKGEIEHGKWALPGGFVDTLSKKGEPWKQDKETPKQAIIRELIEETGLNISNIANMLKKIGTYKGHKRDPRDNDKGWSLSNAYAILLPNDFNTSNINAKDDASELKWFDIKSLPNLAFDHSIIIKHAISRIFR